MGGVTSALTILLIYNMRGPSRSVFLLNILLLFVFIGASRMSFRLLGVLVRSQRNKVHPAARYVLIYGAGDGGELLIREILNNPDHGCAPVGFIDDDARKAGKKIHGYRIFSSNDLPDLIRRHGVNEVLISSAKVSESKLDELRGLGVQLRKMSIRIESIPDV
jgi:UDP-GlcNAc:undecaprenyl-phosphate GlcNAc-1-phosphate transferase